MKYVQIEESHIEMVALETAANKSKTVQTTWFSPMAVRIRKQEQQHGLVMECHP